MVSVRGLFQADLGRCHKTFGFGGGCQRHSQFFLDHATSMYEVTSLSAGLLMPDRPDWESVETHAQQTTERCRLCPQALVAQGIEHRLPEP